MEDKEPQIGSVITEFIAEIESISQIFPPIMGIIGIVGPRNEQKYKSLLDKIGTVISNEAETTIYSIPIEFHHKVDELKKEIEIYRKANRIVPKSFIVSIISQYDGFLGKLLRELFKYKPEILNASEKKLTYEQLCHFKNIEDAQEYIVENEIGGFLRESHEKQFDWMEKIFNIELRKNLSVWNCFIELTERRNLYVHCNGIVNEQYLTKCLNCECNSENCPSIGEELIVSPEYFIKATNCIMEIAVKLGHVLWRKVKKEELDYADENLNRIIFDLLINENYELAITMADFAITTIKKHSSEEIKRYMLINKIIALKFSGNKEIALKILNEHDWSACNYKINLAVAVLNENYQEAQNIMKKIGDEAEMKVAYIGWPLFREFRSKKEFLETYKEIFGISFEDIEKNIQKVVKESTQEDKPGLMDTGKTKQLNKAEEN